MPQAKKKNTHLNVGGRPRKFSTPSRSVTVTLPEATLELLHSIDTDRALAIAKATEWISHAGSPIKKSVHLVEVEKGNAIILVGPSKYLKTIPFLRLLEISPARFLLVTPTGLPIDTLEVAIIDILNEVPENEKHEKELLTELSKCLATQRRSKTISKEELLLVSI